MTLSDYDKQHLGFEQESLARYIADQVFQRASGRGIDICTQNHPRDVYFLGNLRPAPSEEDDPFIAGRSNELINKLAPVAFGAEFRLIPDSAHQGMVVRVALAWNCYYRIVPTFEEQRSHQFQAEINNRTGEDEESTTENSGTEVETDDDRAPADTSPDVTDSAADRRKKRKKTDTLFIKFRQISCHAEGEVSIQPHQIGDGVEWEIDTQALEQAIKNETERARQLVIADPDALKTNSDIEDNVRIPDTALADDSSYRSFLATLMTPIIPTWEWSVGTAVRETNTSREKLFSVEFTNSSPISDKAKNLEGFLFDVQAAFAFVNCQTEPLEFELAPQGFRYDPFLPARGFNCNVLEIDDGETDYTLVTETMPIFRQRRYQTQTRPKAHFRDLADDPIPVLMSILDAMREYAEKTWKNDLTQYASETWWNEQYQQEFSRDYDQFSREIEHFERGIQLLQRNSDVLLAFKLTNETFSRGPKESWRLFQIVFLVSQMPAIAALADTNQTAISERKVVDIIYFPTGGGKTEAYLSVIVFHCFFDRLRGKKAGVTAWTRFPLRLLTLQQTQRVADVIGLADIVRREQTHEPRLSGRGVAPFGVGYFVGSGATPNKLSPPYGGGYASPEWQIAQDHYDRQRWKRIVSCPSCRTTTVEVDFDAEKIRLYHRCTNKNCKFEDGIIPVYVVDYEIYRYLPSVIVGTIDKLAGIGNQTRMSLILGRVDGICPDHGFYIDKCTQDGCTRQKNEMKPLPPNTGLSGPTLFVQDELHLLKEGLGTFDAHYETFTQELLREFGQKHPLKIIASSATIEAFERQVEHLYGRDTPAEARVFPGLGPRLQYSFYAETLEYPQRLFVGLIPHNKTIFNSILELIQYYHEIVQDLSVLESSDDNPYGGDIQPDTEDWKELIELYKTSLTYFLNTRELHSIKTDLEGAVNPDLEDKNYQPLMISELTGSVSTSDVAITLERLERKSSEDDAPDTVLATNMVSHGVDIDYLNAMIFYGMPSHVAEYIQSSSRVGRTHVGIVFMCMHPARERDQSHYSYFSKFHEYLGQLIEPVAINRWSRFSITRTLPGLFMSMLLQIISQRFDASGGRFTRLDYVKQQIRDGRITQSDFTNFLEEAYQVKGDDSPGAVAFRQDIERGIGQFFDQILGAGPHVEWVSDALIPSPMRSLRDVDEQLEVELDDNGSSWAARK